MRILLLISIALVAGCGDSGGGGHPGKPCASDADCGAGGICLTGYPGGYCSSDCSNAPCPTGASCAFVGGHQACVTSCTGAGSCGAGQMCFRKSCQPACVSDGDCGKGYSCASGSCQTLAADSCGTDGDCPTGQTCYVNPIASKGTTTDGILPKCIALRAGGKQPGDPCTSDGSCERGSCQLGVCTTLCQVNSECPTTPPMSCAQMVAHTDKGTPAIRSCIFKSGTLTVDLADNPQDGIGVPSNVVGWNVFVAATGQDLSYYAGISTLVDPANVGYFVVPQTTPEYYALLERYEPSEGTSMVLVPNSPKVKLVPGFWTFTTFAQTPGGMSATFDTRVRFKFGDAPPTSGSIPLHVFVPDLTGGCGTLDSAGKASFESEMKKIYAAANLNISEVTYTTVSGPADVTANTMGISPEVDMRLATATASDTPDALEMVLVRHISANAGNGFEVLGQAGGIPASTGIPGTPHSGAIISMTSFCLGPTGRKLSSTDGGINLAVTAAHELGHSMGLFHNTEMDGHHSPLGDDVHDGTTNLMYWSEDSASQIHLTPNQKTVLLSNPAVAQ